MILLHKSSLFLFEFELSFKHDLTKFLNNFNSHKISRNLFTGFRLAERILEDNFFKVENQNTNTERFRTIVIEIKNFAGFCFQCVSEAKFGGSEMSDLSDTV